MPDFIIETNIAHYKELLATETDARKIAMIHKLLAEEETKLAESRAKKSKTKGGGVGPVSDGGLILRED